MDALWIMAMGVGGSTWAYTLLRVATGLFFLLSGWNKLFNAGRHETLLRTLQADRVRCVGVMQWVIPLAEFFGGLALVIGFLTPVAAMGLLLICLGACVLDGLRRIPSLQPINMADYIDDVLYLPESIYCLVLALFVTDGAGPWSVDNLLALWAATHGG